MQQRAMTIGLAFLWLSGPGAAGDLQSLFPSADPSVVPVAVAQHSPSLFGGAASLFAPSSQAGPGIAPDIRRPGSRISALLDLIARAEAGPEGYDAVQYGARIRPDQAPTRLTLGEIYDWIDATPGQPHAIGRYQFIPTTLRRLAAIHGAERRDRFSPELQDALATILLDEAGYGRFASGALEREAFMYNLARIWAGLPLPSGESYYENHAGNSATMTWARFAAGMEQIWPTS